MFPSLPKSRNGNLFPNIPKRSKKQSLFPSFNRMKKMGKTFKFLNGWNKNNIYEITINHTEINRKLTHYPITIVLNSTNASDLFSHLGTNWEKIAIADENAKELYIEKEQYNSSISKACFHCSKSDFILNNSKETKLYLYYDNTHADNVQHVGAASSTPAKKVWNNSHRIVYNLAQDPSGGTNTIKDSTINSNYGDAYNMASSDLINGNVGKALKFDVYDKYIEHSSTINYGKNPVSIMGCCKLTSTGGSVFLLTEAYDNNKNSGRWSFLLSETKCELSIYQGTTFSYTHTFNLNTWYHIAITSDSLGRVLYINGDAVISDSLTTLNDAPVGINKYSIGNHWYYIAHSIDKGRKQIENVKIFNIAVPASLVKTEAQMQLNNLVTIEERKI